MAFVQFNWVSCRARSDRALCATSIAHEAVAILLPAPRCPSPARSLRSKALQYRVAQTRCGNPDRVDRSLGREFRAVPTARSAVLDLVPNPRLRAGSNRLRPAPAHKAKPDSAAACAAASMLRWRQFAQARYKSASLPGMYRG